MPGFEYIGDEERKKLNKIFSENSSILMSVGFEKLRKKYLVREFEQKFKKLVSSKYAVALTSGTVGLNVGLKSLSIGYGDEVLLQTFTFIAVAESIISVGAKPVFVNIDETLNMDLKELEKKISKKTKAIISAGMLGNPVNSKKLKEISKKYKIPVIDDSCETLGSKIDNKLYGNEFDLTVWSFDSGKTITTGEGGMITTNNKKIYEFCKYYIDHGHENKKNIPRGIDKAKVLGFNFRMTELQAAVGLAQIAKIKRIVSDQKIRYEIYEKTLKNLGIKIRPLLKNFSPNYDTLIFFLDDKNKTKKFLKYLIKNKLNSKIIPDALKWHFVKYWKQLGNNLPPKKQYIVSENILNKCIALPILGKSKITTIKHNCEIIKNYKSF